jgi:hypothetical protein
MKEKGFDTFFESLPKILGNIDTNNMLSVSFPTDIFTMPTKEEHKEQLRKEIPGYE